MGIAHRPAGLPCPAIVEAILAGTQPASVSTTLLRTASLLTGWDEQISMFLSDSENRTYISTTSRMISGEELKQQNGLGRLCPRFASHPPS